MVPPEFARRVAALRSPAAPCALQRGLPTQAKVMSSGDFGVVRSRARGKGSSPGPPLQPTDLPDREGGCVPRCEIACGIAGLDFQAVVTFGEVVGRDLLHNGDHCFAGMKEFGRRAGTAVDLEIAGGEISDTQLEPDIGRGGSSRRWCSAQFRGVHFKVGEEWIPLLEGRVGGGREFDAFADKGHELRGKNAVRVQRRIHPVIPLTQGHGAKIELLLVVAFYTQRNVNTTKFLAIAENHAELVVSRRQIYLGLVAGRHGVTIVTAVLEFSEVCEGHIARTTGLIAEARSQSSVLSARGA